MEDMKIVTINETDSDSYYRDENEREKVYKIFRVPARNGNEIQINETLTAEYKDSHGYGHFKILEIVPDQNMEEVFKEVKKRMEEGIKNDSLL